MELEEKMKLLEPWRSGSNLYEKKFKQMESSLEVIKSMTMACFNAFITGKKI